MARLDGKVAVITGAASGMGRATAVRFAGEGAAVVIADLNEDGGAAAVRECKENGGRAVFQKTDVTSEADVKSMVDRAVKEFGRLDITFNNAGLPGALGSIEQTSVEDWDRTFAVLTRGVFLGIKHSVAEMRKVGGGSIISTASVAGLAGGYGPHAYSAAKAGVVNLTRSVALEVAKDKIRVNCICPGGHQHADFQLPHLRPRGDGPVARPVASAAPRGPARGHREHGAVPGQRRIGMDNRRRDGGRRRADGRTRHLWRSAVRRRYVLGERICRPFVRD